MSLSFNILETKHGIKKLTHVTVTLEILINKIILMKDYIALSFKLFNIDYSPF